MGAKKSKAGALHKVCVSKTPFNYWRSQQRLKSNVEVPILRLRCFSRLRVASSQDKDTLECSVFPTLVL